MTIGENLKSYRKEKSLTQKTLSKKLGISTSYMSELESNKRNPSIETVNKIAEKSIEYGVPVLIHSFHKSTGQYPFETTGKNVEILAKRYPELKIVMAHYGGNCYNGIPMIRDLKNVWIDTSGSICSGDVLNYTIENIGTERILFGSDMPGDYITNVGKVMEADLTKEEKDMIFYKNTLKVFDKNFRL